MYLLNSLSKTGVAFNALYDLILLCSFISQEQNVSDNIFVIERKYDALRIRVWAGFSFPLITMQI